MNDQVSADELEPRSSDQIEVYENKYGAKFLFDRELTPNEILYNDFTYYGTMKDLQASVLTKSLKQQIAEKEQKNERR